ncbi:MAG: TonB family protein [Bacteroidaceae bacterium]
MNCFFHEDRPAVATCAQCHVGLCRDCVNNAITLDGQPLCPNCGKSIVMERIGEAQKDKTWSLVKFIFSGVFLGIGLSALAGGADIMHVWIVSGVAGLPTAFSMTRRSREQRMMDDIHDRYETDMMNLLFGWIMRLLLKLVFVIGLAPICAIYTCISNLIKFFSSKKSIRTYEGLLAQVEQCLNDGANSFAGQQPQMESNMATDALVQPEIPERTFNPAQPQTNTVHTQPTQAAQTPPVTSSRQAPASKPAKRSNPMLIGIAAGAVVLVGLVAGYFMWYVPYAKDRDALRTYVVANNVFLRSSKVAGVEYNVLSKVPYGAELITYFKDTEWAEVKVKGVEGFVASPYLLEWNDFKLLNDVWGGADTKEYIESSKCRLALLDYCKHSQFATGNGDWQLYTLQKDVKPNNVLFPRLKNGYDKFTEFAFILKNNTTQERRLAIYSFDEETESPVFLYEETAPEDGQIKQIRYTGGEYIVSYTGNGKAVTPPKASMQPTAEIKRAAPVIEEEKKEEELATVDGDTPTASNEVAAASAEDNNIYETVEQMPEYPNGGVTGLMNFISNNLRYPTICEEMGVQGKVVVSFVVDKDGSTTDFRVVRSVDKHLDKEAIRVLSTMPKWKPGMQKGVPVRVKYAVPINFRLS